MLVDLAAHLWPTPPRSRAAETSPNSCRQLPPSGSPRDDKRARALADRWLPARHARRVGSFGSFTPVDARPGLAAAPYEHL